MAKPSEYKKAREQQKVVCIDGKPYYPDLRVSNNDATSVARVTAIVLGFISPSDENEEFVNERLTVTVVEGGITNALYRVCGLQRWQDNGKSVLDGADSVLVRVFGAEGMIDRDVENSTFAALCDAKIAYRYYGRFGNGRLEGWLDDYTPLNKLDFRNEEISNLIAVQMARLHTEFGIPTELKFYHSTEGGMWNQIDDWMAQASSIALYPTTGDEQRVSELLNLENLKQECIFLKEQVHQQHGNARMAFCHNDLLPANIMRRMDSDGSADVQLIDFEYGGTNFIAYDIANHFNEHAGGTTSQENGVPDYTLFPSPSRQRQFVSVYVMAVQESRRRPQLTLKNESCCEVALNASPAPPLNNDDEAMMETEIDLLLAEVQTFVLVNHLYWGLWSVIQASTEGTEKFDYLTFAANRFRQYFVCKKAKYAE